MGMEIGRTYSGSSAMIAIVGVDQEEDSLSWCAIGEERTLEMMGGRE